MREDDQLAELKRRIALARLEVEQNVHHDLSYGRVMSILSMYGPRLKEGVISAERAKNLGISVEEHRAALFGWQRRVWNAFLCAKKILPFWSVEVVEPFLSSEDAQQLRQIDMRYLIAEAQADVLLKQQPPLTKFELSDDDLTSKLYGQIRISKPIYQAVSTYGDIQWTLFIARSDEFNIFEPNRIYPCSWGDDEDIDSYGVPRVIWASYTFAGRVDGHFGPLNDAYARREFWLWWLDEAVLASWVFQT